MPEASRGGSGLAGGESGRQRALPEASRGGSADDWGGVAYDGRCRLRQHLPTTPRQLRNTKVGSPLSGDGSTGRRDLGGMLEWNDGELFRSVLAHPKLVPYFHLLLGTGYRMDHLPLLISQSKGAEGFSLHGESGRRRQVHATFDSPPPNSQGVRSQQQTSRISFCSTP